MAAPSQADIQAGVPAGANIVGRVPAPSGKGELLVDANGGVYDTGGQSFGGSYYSLAPEQRQGSRQFTGIRVDPTTGGYTLQSDQPGQEYNFGPSDYVKNMAKANPLYSDPAFLSFVANAGIDYDTAANDVNRRQAALQNALTPKLAQDKQNTQDSVDSVYKGYAARGLYGASQQATDEDKVQAQGLAQQAADTADTNNQINDLHSGLVQKRQQYLTDAANKGLSTAGTQDLNTRLGEVDRKYPGLATTGSS